jgi:hypothetical protein
MVTILLGAPVVHAKHFLSNIGAACILPGFRYRSGELMARNGPVRFSPDLLWEVGAMHLGIKEKNDIIEGIVKGGRPGQRIVVREEFAVAESTGFRIIVDGQSRPLNPLIRDQVYRIGRESGMPSATPAPQWSKSKSTTVKAICGWRFATPDAESMRRFYGLAVRAIGG